MMESLRQRVRCERGVRDHVLRSLALQRSRNLSVFVTVVMDAEFMQVWICVSLSKPYHIGF